MNAWAENDDLYIEGQPDLQVPQGLVFDSRKDHRLAMTWSLVGLCSDTPVDIIDFDSVSVSFPTFLELSLIHIYEPTRLKTISYEVGWF